MTDHNLSLSGIHHVPWENIEGAYVRVKQETTDPLAGSPADLDQQVNTEIREGEIVGRGAGQGLSYDSGDGETHVVSIGPAVYLDTPEDTVLEVRTDKAGNELLDFHFEGGSDE